MFAPPPQRTPPGAYNIWSGFEVESAGLSSTEDDPESEENQRRVHGVRAHLDVGKNRLTDLLRAMLGKDKFLVPWGEICVRWASAGKSGTQT